MWFYPVQAGSSPQKKTDWSARAEGGMDFSCHFLNLFLKRFNNAKGFKLCNKIQKEIPLGWHRLHPSLTLGSEKHMQKMDVLLHRLLLFPDLEQKQTFSSKSELTAFLHAGHKIVLCSVQRKPWQGAAHHLQSGMIPVCRSQDSQAVNASVVKTQKAIRWKLDGRMPEFRTKLELKFELKWKTKGSLQQSSCGRCRQSEMDSSQGRKNGFTSGFVPAWIRRLLL